MDKAKRELASAGAPELPAGVPSGMSDNRSDFVSQPSGHIDPRRSQMSTGQATSNKAAFKRFHDGVNTDDVELISNTIDELVEPEALIHTPLPIEAAGRQLLKQVWAMLLAAFPTFT